jgi:hypothetical protein
MTASSELIDHVKDTTIPDKNRILRTRFLADQMTKDIVDRTVAERLTRSLNDAYLNLQLATIADDADMVVRCRHDCIALIGQIEKAADGRSGVPGATIAFHQ